jgi:acyl-CoA reductase-like NAD-dependent aldehyde dehydrogenase
MPDLALHTVPTTHGPAIDVRSPATGEPVIRVAAQTPETVDRLCEQAAAAAPSWAALGPDGRRTHLLRLSALLVQHMGDLAALESRVTGRPIREMRAQMARIPEWIDYFGSIATGLEAESNWLKGDYLTYTSYQPYGVCALLTPWNHPLLILTKKLAAALAAGNTVVVKPSELAPVTPLVLADLCREAGLPDGVVAVANGEADVGRALVNNRHIARIDFTGGSATGRAVAEAAARRLVPATLELGGKAPVVIFADAPLDEAVAGALFAAFVAAGQTCVSGARILVEEPVYAAFLDRFAARTRSLRVGDPADPATDVGPVISERSRRHCLELIADAAGSGARLICGGEAPRLPPPLSAGHFIAPTVFADVDPRSRLFQEEVFGPVVAVTPFRNETEAVALANDSPYALGASVWTRDVMRAHRIGRQIEAGIVWLNDHHRNDPRSIWGGFGESGYGKENGHDALKAYLRKRSTVVRTADRFDDWFAGGSRYG